MNIPRYWSKGEAAAADRKGREMRFSCWRGSMSSLEEARQLAAEAARQIVDRVLRGEMPQHYAYCDAPLREEILQEINDLPGGDKVVVTRNASGAVVLNTSRVMFVDVDFPAPTVGDRLRELFRVLFRRPGPTHEEKAKAVVLDRVQSCLQDRQASFRVYATRAGMRLLATHDLFDPADAKTLALLESLGADPMYVRLCRAQQCFRARLTPKPWRCGCQDNKTRFPREGAGQEERFKRWLADYEAAAGRFATCRYLRTVGGEAVHPATEEVIALHDKLTRAHESLQLA
jgi:hypothetical protein